MRIAVWKMQSFLIAWCILFFCPMMIRAQNTSDYIKEYGNEQAVITNISEKLVIENRGGKLSAYSLVNKEKLLIGQQSPALFNTEYIYHSYFNKLEHHEEKALIPSGKGYKRISNALVRTQHSEQNNIFYDDARQTEISFNGLLPGSLLRIGYTISHTDVHMLPAYYFQENLSVAKSVYEVTAPKSVEMRFVLKGADADKVVQTKREGKNDITYTFTTNKLAPYHDYDDAPSLAWHGLHIIPYIAAYRNNEREYVPFLSTPDDLYHYFYEFIRHINVTESKELNDATDEIIRGATTNDEKAKRIYEWVQQNIRYIAFEDSLEGFIPRQAAVVYQRRFGDCKDMASILAAMCRRAGIPAYFTWIGTRTKPYTYEETPLPIVANHMICAIKPTDKWVLLDGTHSIIPYGEIPYNLQGKQAMIGLDEKNFAIITVPETKAEENGYTDTSKVRIDGRTLTGTASIDFMGHMSWNMQINMLYTRDKEKDLVTKNIATRGNNKYLQSAYHFDVGTGEKKDCRLHVTFTIGDYVQYIENEYYVNMNLKRNFDGSYIDTADRRFPYHFKYKDIETEVTILDVPAGYKVAYLPPTATDTLYGIWWYNIEYNIIGSKIILSKTYKLESLIIPPDRFATHNKMIEKLKKQYKESVVLTSEK